MRCLLANEDRLPLCIHARACLNCLLAGEVQPFRMRDT